MPKSLYELTLDQLSVSVDALAKKSYRKLIGLIEQGVPPQEAVQAIYLSFSKGTFNEMYLTALSKAFTTLLERPFTPTELMVLKVGNVSLSGKLYQNGKTIGAEVVKIIEEHTKVLLDLRKLSLDLYSGYGQKSIEILRMKDVLPKYMKKTWQPLASEFDREAARLLASGLQTDGLRAAYVTMLNKLEKDAGKKALQKALEACAHEKARYLANRIAQNETSIAYHKAQAKKILERTDISVVQIRPSARHSPDICDTILKADHYGLGEGRYPAEQAPRPPLHMFCKCRAIAVVNEQVTPTTERRPDSTKDYFNSLSDEEALRIAGSKNNLEKLRSGGSIGELLNKGHSPDYRIKNLAGNELGV